MLEPDGWSVELDPQDAQTVLFASFFFASSWAHYETARPGTFRLLSAQHDRLDGLRRDYEVMQSMIFGTAPSWDEIVDALRTLEGRINGMVER